jgi:geranylgeranyl reductase family protein
MAVPSAQPANLDIRNARLLISAEKESRGKKGFKGERGECRIQDEGVMYDVAVVGSGPAGSSAAFSLSRQGLRVALIEKASLPRHKVCGGGVVRRAIRLLPTDVGEAIERECCRVDVSLLRDGLRFSVIRSEPIISMTMRDKFDFILLSSAEVAGTTVFSECKVLNIVSHVNKVELMTTKGTLFARFVVAADGAMSLVARKAGWKETRKLIPAHEYQVVVNDDVLDRFTHSPRFDIDAVPGGYAWVFPKKEHLSIGVLSMQLRRINLNGFFEKYLKLLGIDEIRSIVRHAFLIPTSPRKDAFVKGRVLLVGDAAGFADPIVGEGITFAIQSGQVVARALLSGHLDENRVGKTYESELSRSLLKELRLARILAKVVYDYRGLRNWLFGLYGQRFTEALMNVFTGVRTYRELLFNPLNYLGLLKSRFFPKFFSRP